MAVTDRANLQTQADTIRNETNERANTAERVGRLFRDMADTFELIGLTGSAYDTLSDVREAVTSAGSFYLSREDGSLWLGFSDAAPGTYTDNGGTVLVEPGGDGSAAKIRQFSGPIDGAWFGAKGTGLDSDASSNTVAIQAAIDAALSGVNSVQLQPGNYFINGTLLIDDALRFSLYADSATISWRGNTSDTMLELRNSRECHVRGLELKATGVNYPVALGLDITRDSAATKTVTRHDFVNVTADGTDGYMAICYKITTEAGYGNNSEHRFTNCQARKFGDAASVGYTRTCGWHNVEQQSKAIRFIDCGFNGTSTGQYGYYGHTSCDWLNSGGGQCSEADFYLTGPNDQGYVKGHLSEGSASLLRTASTANGAAFSMENVRYSALEIRPDNQAVFWKLGGSLAIRNSYFHAGNVIFRIGADSSDVTFTLEDSFIQSATDYPIEQASLGALKVRFVNNTKNDSATSELYPDHVSSLVVPNGATASRPASPTAGDSFFDTTISKPIWFDGADWVDATGATV